MTTEHLVQGSLWSESLFPDHRDTGLGRITWSHSRRELLEKCARRYYYEYFGAAAHFARAEPKKAVLGQLKRLQNRYERAGTILHLAIAAYLRAAGKGEVWTQDRLIRWATGLLAADRAYSASDPDGLAPPEQRFPPVLLREYHYREKDASEKVQEIEHRLTSALLAFLTDPVFADFRSAGSVSNALIETRLHLATLPCRVTGQIDLAYRHGEQFTVVDWKMGIGDGGGDDSLQLAVYGLWAQVAHGVAVDRLKVYKAHLGGRVVQTFTVSHRLLSAARSRVLQDAERMAHVAPYGAAAIVDAFTPNPHQKVCGLCNFQRVCPGGRAFLRD